MGHPTNPSTERIDIAPSKTYNVGLWVRASKAKTIQLSALVYNSSGTQVGSTTFGTAVTVGVSTWTRIFVTFTSGATGVRLVLQALDTDATRWSIGNTMDADALLVWDPVNGAIPAYADPSTDPTLGWSATANASTTTKYIPAITLTSFTDANPTPRVQVTIIDFPPSVQTVNVLRTSEGRTMKVRGGVALFAFGGVAVVDVECPFGRITTYTAEQFDINGVSLGLIVSASVTLAVTDTWISQPLSPALAVKVRLFIDSANDKMKGSPGGVVWPEGATVGRLIGGQRVGLQGTSIRIRLSNAADADELDSMFGGYVTDFPAVILIRTPASIRLPGVLFAGCLDPHEVTVGGNYAMITYQMTIDEVAPPSPGLVLPALRRKDIDYSFATRAARTAAYATRLLRDTDYTKAGIAP
jgi:hypothetical protein